MVHKKEEGTYHRKEKHKGNAWIPQPLGEACLSS